MFNLNIFEFQQVLNMELNILFTNQDQYFEEYRELFDEKFQNYKGYDSVVSFMFEGQVISIFGFFLVFSFNSFILTQFTFSNLAFVYSILFKLPDWDFQ